MTSALDIQDIFHQLLIAYKPITKELNRKIMHGEISTAESEFMFPPQNGEPLTAQKAETGFLKYNCGVITAFRGTRDLLSNRKVNAKLEEDLIKLRLNNLLDYRHIDGCYKEVTMENASHEECFFIFDADPKRFNAGGHRQLAFFTSLYQLSEKYEQDSFLYKCAGMSRQAFLISTNDNQRANVGNIDEAGFLYLNLPMVGSWSGLDKGRFTFRKTPPTREELEYSLKYK